MNNQNKKCCTLAFQILLPLMMICIWKSNGETQDELPESLRKYYHYIVVGGGTAGSVVASRLSEDKRINVLLLEAGTSDTDIPEEAIFDVPRLWENVFSKPHLFWDYKILPQRYIFTKTNATKKVNGAKVLGGASTINAMGNFRGCRNDYDLWSARGATGWSYNEVFPYFLKSEDNTDQRLRNSSLHGKNGPMTITLVPLQAIHKDLYELIKNGTEDLGLQEKDCVDPNPVGFCKMQHNIRSGQRMSTAKAYLRNNKGRRNLDVLTEAFVTKVAISQSKRRARGVYFIWKGKRLFIRATREVVLSAGTVGSAKLLLLSGVGPRHDLRKVGVRNIIDLPVGRGLKDHIALQADVIADIYSVQRSDLLKPEVVAEYLFRRTGLYSYPNVVLDITLDTVRHEEFDRPDIKFTVTEASYLMNGGSRISEDHFISEIRRRPDGYTSFITALETKSKGTVKLKSANPLVAPEIDPRYLENIEDVRLLIRGIKAMRNLVNTPSYRKVNALLIFQDTRCPNNNTYSDEYLECLVRARSFAFNHMTSTCKMGSTLDRTTVVNHQLQVKGISNLRVADASIMPEIPSGNTHAIVVMIAEKAADMIRNSWSRSDQDILKVQ